MGANLGTFILEMDDRIPRLAEIEQHETKLDMIKAKTEQREILPNAAIRGLCQILPE